MIYLNGEPILVNISMSSFLNVIIFWTNFLRHLLTVIYLNTNDTLSIYQRFPLALKNIYFPIVILSLHSVRDIKSFITIILVVQIL